MTRKTLLMACPHKHYLSEMPKCQNIPLQKLLKEITDSMNCKLYCAYIISSICEDMLGFFASIEILIMRTILNNDALFHLIFIPLTQGNVIKIFIFVIVILNSFLWIQLSPLMDTASFFSLFSLPVRLHCFATLCQTVSRGLERYL